MKLVQTVRQFSEIHCRLIASENGIRTLTLQRDKAKNALGQVLVSQLMGHLEELQRDKQARVLVLNSAVPGVFCSGADLKERAGMSQAEAELFVMKLRSSFSMLEALSIPTIACVHGYALGGGLELALACDLRVAHSSSIVGLPETSLAILPGAGGTQRLPKLIGLTRAKEMILTAARYNVADLSDYGLFNYIGEDPIGKAQEYAAKISENGPVGVRMAKKAIDTGFNSHNGMEVERLCYAQVIPTSDRLEALQAFKEKRKPKFKGE